MPGPTSIRITSIRNSVAENSATSSAITYAQATLLGPVGADNIVSLSGADADLFILTQLSSRVYNLSLRTGVYIDFETNPKLDVTVSARDAAAPPSASVSASFAVNVTDVNEGNATKISAIQGAGDTSPLVGQNVLVQARVTAWLPKLNLFFVQEEKADQDGQVQTSEGVAVYYGNNPSPVSTANIGDVVRFNATVAEFNGLTELTSLSNFTVVHDGTSANLDPYTDVKLPIASGTTLERFEGMTVNVAAASGGDLYVADTFTYARFGEITFYADEVPEQFTQQNLPNVGGNAAHLEFLARNSIQLDDANSKQNPSLGELASGSAIVRDGQAFGPDNFVRVGDHTDGLLGVLSYSFGSYEVNALQSIALQAAPRPVAPDASQINASGSAEIKVASFNVLNYFVNFQQDGTTADNFTNPLGVSHEPRGANNQTEFERQKAKTVEAIIGTGADILALNEMQNNGFADGSSAIDNLVDALNTKLGVTVYDYVRAPYDDGDGGDEATAGGDAIMVAFIYKVGTVKPLGQAATPDLDVYSAFANGSRPPVAQTFAYAGDESKQVTVVANHFKSKGSLSNNFAGDADSGDGQGNNNPTRVEAAAQLAQWIATNPTGATDGDYLLLGDFNSYASEDPIRYLTDPAFNEGAIYGGYNIPAAAEALSGTYTYLGSKADHSYVFDGLVGSLDHAIASAGLAGEVTGITHWHINADEQIALDYNTEFNPSGLYAVSPYRSSDHDPLIVGLRLNSEAGNPPPPDADHQAPGLTGSTPADNTSNVAKDANIVLSFNEPVAKGTGNITLKGLDGAADVVIAVSNAQVSVSGNSVTINPSADLAAGKAYAVLVDQGAIQDTAGNAFAGIANVDTLNFNTKADAPPAASVAFISEIHYDNSNLDVNEAIAISGTAGLDLTGWSLVLYNGNGGAPYFTKALSGVIDDEGGTGWGEVAFAFTDGAGNPTSAAIQNGSPDGVALLNNGVAVQFLSYEGAFVAVGGAANGMTSTDILVAETSNTPLGSSVQLVGTIWTYVSGSNSLGTLNTGFVAP